MKRKILTALLSVAIAFALWSYVIMVVGPEYQDTFRDIPVSFQGASALEERGLMALIGDVPKVTLVLAGNRSELNKLNSSNISLSVDLSRIYDPGKTALIPSVYYPGNVPNGAITLQSRNPSSVTVEIVRRLAKEIPVEIDYVGSLNNEDYIKGKPELEMETLRIVGPESTVEQIASARIEMELTQDMTSDVTASFQYTLCDGQKKPVDAKYVEVTGESVETIDVNLPIKRVKTLPLQLEVIPGGGATADNVTLEFTEIQVSGSEEVLKNLTQVKIGPVDLATVLEDTVLNIPLVLPEGVVNETGAAEVQVTVSLSGLETRTFQASRLETKNVPAGMKAMISKTKLDVLIRGAAEELDELDPNSILVTVDCTNLQTGKQYLEARVTVENTKLSVGAVDQYTLLVTAEKQERSVE